MSIKERKKYDSRRDHYLRGNCNSLFNHVLQSEKAVGIDIEAVAREYAGGGLGT